MEVLLPKLNNARLTDVGRQQHLARRSLTTNNDKLKRTCVRLRCNLQKQSHVQNYLFWKETMVYKKSLVEHKGLQVCLRRRREKCKKALPTSPTFQNGVYNGLKLESMKPEVKGVIWENHPRTRRLREVENTKKLWKLNGNLVDYNKCLQSLDAIIKRQKDVLPAIMVDRSIPATSQTDKIIRMQPVQTKHFFVLPPIVPTKPMVK